MQVFLKTALNKTKEEGENMAYNELVKNFKRIRDYMERILCLRIQKPR